MYDLESMQSHAFDFIRENTARLLNKENLPTISEYNDFLKNSPRPILSAHGQAICAVKQETTTSLQDNYEASIYLRGELRTRDNNWHDFFNLMMWYTFPNIKAVINKWQYKKLSARDIHAPRSHAENLLTQLDEGGIIIVSSNSHLINLIKHYDWKTLFWQHQSSLKTQMDFCLIGHAIYEKLLNPWVGISCPALLFEVPPSYFHLHIAKRAAYLDDLAATYLDNDTWHVYCPKLRSTPILGIPGWYAPNIEEAFYDNKKYFWAGTGTGSEVRSRASPLKD